MSRHYPPMNPYAMAPAEASGATAPQTWPLHGQRPTDCAGDHDQRKNNDDYGFMTPSFYRPRLWPNRSRISAKVGAGGLPRRENLPHVSDAAAKRPLYTVEVAARLPILRAAR
jgi:hypothetical protein